MKTYKSLAFVLFVFFANPCTVRAHDSVKEELRPILEEIQCRVNRNAYSNEPENSPLIIAIGGCPGVGKSTVSQLLQFELSEIGISSAILSLDHYGIGQEERKQFTCEMDPRRIQWHELHNTLISIREGENEIPKPTVNQLTKEIGLEILHLANTDCVLFEGTYALGDFPPMDFLQYADLAVYLESSAENIYDRKWQRELKKSSPRSPEAFFNHMMEILRDFAFHVYPTRKNADYIVHIDFFHRYSILDSRAGKNRPEPDFTSLRLETLTY